MWKAHLDTIGPRWRETLTEWMPEDELPDFDGVVGEADNAMRALRM